MNLSRISLGVVAALMLFSCSQDTNAPLIDIQEPFDGANISLGTTLHVEVDIEDLSELGQFKVELDGKHSNALNELFVIYDTVLHIGEILGNATSEHLHFVIPDTVLPGPYTLRVSALDEFGNEGTASVNLTFVKDLDTRKPDVTINTPVTSQTVNDSLHLDATILDKLSDNVTDGTLHYIRVYLQSVSNPSQFHQLGTYTGNNNFAGLYDSGTGSFLKSFFIPGSIPAGNYYLYVVGRDIYFNEKENFVQIQLL